MRMFVDFDAEWPPPPPWTPKAGAPDGKPRRLSRSEERWLIGAILVFLALFTIGPLAGAGLIGMGLAMLGAA
jgi:hypothetical protein